MGRKIVIRNFGPLKDATISLNKNLYVVIGQQAVGKSTMSKAIYFCRKIRDYLKDYAREILNRNIYGEYQENFLRFLRTPFMGCFGTTKHMDSFEIQYFYDDSPGMERSVKITLGRRGYVNFAFSENLKEEIRRLLNLALDYRDSSVDNLLESFRQQQDLLALFARECDNVFRDDERLLYIPAGRNLLATIPDFIGSRFGSAQITVNGVDIRQLDLITQEFTEHIRHIRDRFGVRLGEIVENYLKTVRGQIPNKDVELARDLIRQILKGEYVYDRDFEKLYYQNDKWIKFMFASSGQQEILWALNSIFLLILQREKTFLIFEEPESHLFPDSQEQIARLIALLINSNGSEVFVTTHSPYMLTAFNLLAYSGQVEKEKAERSSVVERQFRIKHKAMMAYYLQGSKERMVSLMEDGLIKASAIDDISDVINDKMDQIQDAELYGGGLK